MRDVLGPDTHLGYCTNVHAGATYGETLANLDIYATEVKQHVSPAQPMGIGLWLSASAARQIIEMDQIEPLRHWLAERGLYVFTLNGFPYGDFHSPIVKHAVYRPNWLEQGRYDYTLDLIRILAGLLPDGAEGSISTLPLGWPTSFATSESSCVAARQLLDLVHYLARVELDTGRYIHIDLEPEPGCAMDTSGDVTSFFDHHLLGPADDQSIRGYLQVCHDVCHTAVMGEDQRAAIQRYRDAGLSIGKVQLSSVLRAPFHDLSPENAHAARQKLEQFNEPRYLHQTTVFENGRLMRFFDDLPEALHNDEASEAPVNEWRVHYHMPLFLRHFEELQTTQDDVTLCLSSLQPGEVRHFEVETYAWNVLPAALQPLDLATGLSQELRWVMDAGAFETQQ